jgi:hypothetical protein
MRFRKLRIAWSVGWGLAAVLLIVLWVRSYWRADTAVVVVSQSKVIGFGSGLGSLAASLSDRVPGYFNQTWYIFCDTIGSSGDFRPQSLSGNRKSFGFGITKQRSFTSIYAPCWFFVLVVGVLSSLPWLPWSKRFSLRTLLIATTLVAVGLGLIVCLL